MALHEAAGFTRLGVYQRVGYKLGAWHDVGWWQRRIRPDADPPAEPVGVGVVKRRSGWSALLAGGESYIRPAAV